MRKFSSVLALVVSLVLATAATAQVRGKGRLQGQVVEQGTAKPVAGATVTIAPASGSTAPIVAKTNASGRWSALGLTGGQWHIDIEAAGYTTSRGSANVSETQSLPPIRTELAAAVAAPEETAPAVASGGIPQEAVDALNKGQDLMAQEKFAEAVVELEKVLPHLPDNVALKQLLAQGYYKTANLPKAIALLEAATAAEPANTGTALLLANLYLENSQLDQAKTLIANVPESAITDPTVYVNIGILFLNKENPTDAATYFGKAVGLDATRAEAYYYRGLANVRLNKNAEAKADFQKVLDLAPDSPEARDARQLLAGL